MVLLNQFEREFEMKYTKLIIILVLLSFSTASFAAKKRGNEISDRGSGSASSSKFHLGVGVGSMNTDIPNLSSTSVAWSIIAGTSINNNLGIEVTYANLGRTKLGSFTYLEGSTYSLNLIGKVPVTPAFSLFAKFGVANTGVYSESAGFAGTTYTKTAPTIGLGVQGAITNKIDLRIAYDNYKFTPDDVTTYNSDITSVALLYKF
jgi:opacity protein-like surface antigen